MKNSEEIFIFDYTIFKEWTSNDYIRVWIFDRDITLQSIKTCPGNCYTIRDDSGNDMGIEDAVFDLK